MSRFVLWLGVISDFVIMVCSVSISSELISHKQAILCLTEAQTQTVAMFVIMVKTLRVIKTE